MIRFIKATFSKHPFLSNSITYGSFYVGAEFSQQYITRKLIAKPKEKIDTNSLGRYAIMGTFVYSPTLYTWYKWLDNRYIGTAKQIVTKKLLLDQFLLTPILLVMFYTGMAIMEGKQKENYFDELNEKFIPTFQRSCMFWLPAQTINFIFISPKYRIVYMAVCSFMWCNILCWIKRQKIVVEEEPKEKQ